MVVKDVEFKAYSGKSLLGFAQISLADSDNEEALVVIDGLRLMHKKGNPSDIFVSMPSNKFKQKDGTIGYKDIVFVVSADLRSEITEKVIQASRQSSQPAQPQEPKTAKTNSSMDDLPF